MEDKYDLIVNSEKGEQLFRAYQLDMPSLLQLLKVLRELYTEEVLLVGICPAPMHESILEKIKGEKND